MKIKHYPGKAVAEEAAAWLEMDISNQIRGRRYEANWLKTQETLSSSNNSSTTNSWDKYNEMYGGGTISSRLGQYQTMLDELKASSADQNATRAPQTAKYHSDKCLARINSRPALPNDLKKSVRFKETEKRVNIIANPLADMQQTEDEELVVQERINDWIDDQNKYIDKCDINLGRNDSGYYDNTKKVRQRLPPKHIVPSTSSSDDSISSCVETASSASSTSTSCDNEMVMNLYKNGAKPKCTKTANSDGETRSGDFSIPRPKLILPAVHTYAVRRRRTGNLQTDSSGRSIR